MVLWYAAFREVVCFFRSRESFWLLVGLAAMLSLGLLLPDFLPRFFKGWPEFSIFIVPSDRLISVLAAAESVFLCVLAVFLGHRTIERETITGCWALLRLTPMSVTNILLGKTLGVAVVVLLVHSYCFLPLLSYTPFLRRSHLEVWWPFLGSWLVGVSFIPEGMARAGTPRVPKHIQLLLPLWSLARVGMLLFLLILFAQDPEDGAPRTGVDALLAWHEHPVSSGESSGGAPLSLVSSMRWGVILGWQFLSGMAIWHFQVARRLG